MDGAGRNRWRRTAAMAVMGGCAILGGWVGLSRSAAPEHGAATISLLQPQPAQPAVASVPPVPPAELPAIPVAAAVPDPKPLDAALVAPVPPAIPAVPDSAPVLPPIPAAEIVPAAAPVLPPLPGTPTPEPEPVKAENSNLSIPPIAPVVPVLAPPSVESSVTPAIELAPPPSSLPALPQPILPVKPDSRLQEGNPGNSVKTGNAGQSSGLGTVPPPVETSALPALPPVPPLANAGNPNPAIPTVGSTGAPAGMTVERAKPIELPLPNTEKFEFAIPRQPATTSGETDVSIINKSVAAAVLGGMLYAPANPVVAAPPLPAVPLPASIGAQDKTDLAALKTQVESVNTKLTDIQRDLKLLTELLNGKKDEKGFPLPSDPGIVAEMQRLKDTLALVEKELNKLKTQSSSLRPPTGGTSTEPKPAKGIVRIVNEYPVQISIVVNGTSYRVPSRKSVDVDVPAGDFNYQLLESGAAPTRSIIKDKETVTLRIK